MSVGVGVGVGVRICCSQLCTASLPVHDRFADDDDNDDEDGESKGGVCLFLFLVALLPFLLHLRWVLLRPRGLPLLLGVSWRWVLLALAPQPLPLQPTIFPELLRASVAVVVVQEEVDDNEDDGAEDDGDDDEEVEVAAARSAVAFVGIPSSPFSPSLSLLLSLSW
jgi:hypothetical protein